MKNSFLAAMALGAMALATVPSFARVISPSEALDRVKADAGIKMKARALNPKPVFTVETVTDEPAAYVFSAAEGFMVLSADDEAPAVLGYSDDSTTDPSNMPPSFTYWLEQYAAQIQAARQSGVYIRAQQRVTREPIAPLITTRWNQDAPYNDDAPTVANRKSVTGCVATAMAQIMNYHKWPDQGKGSKEYSWKYDGITYTESMDFSSVTFDWNNMTDVYSSASTTTQKKAVATLMHACGVAVEMMYTPNESAAQSVAVVPALYDYFGYDKSVTVYDRKFYGLNEWEDMVYSQLENYGPVQYSGQSGNGGHSFVCDGYSTDGYFHINWGWGGMSDGYFLLTALDPGSQGIGGSTSGFNYDQDIIANICRPKSNTDFVVAMTVGNFEISETSVQKGKQATFDGFTSNGGLKNLEGYLGMKAVSASGSTIYMEGNDFYNLPFQYGFKNWKFTVPSTIPAGTYKITPVFKPTGGQWTDILIPISGPQYYTMTVAGNTATFTKPDPVTVKVSAIDIKTEIYASVNTQMTFTVSNSDNQEFYGQVCPALYSGKQLYSTGASILVNVPAGESKDYDYMGAFSQTESGAAIAAGTYNLYFIDTETKQQISGAIPVTVNAKPASVTMSVTDFKVNGNNKVTDINDIEFSGKLRVTKGAFGDPLFIAIFPGEGGSNIDGFETRPVFASAGMTVPFSHTTAVRILEEGKSYLAAVFKGQSQLCEAVEFKVEKSTGLESVEATECAMEPSVTDGTTTFTGPVPRSIRVYNLSGTLVAQVEEESTIDIAHLPSGVYFVDIDVNENSKIINRVIRR